MQIVICDIDNVENLITVSLQNNNDTILCPNCKHSMVK